ncbi:MAG: PAS domain S-box protein [Deltaproteobacteria bacterium]|nr:PAS domain S-box protein [Deltaproteobacteria bacterium]
MVEHHRALARDSTDAPRAVEYRLRRKDGSYAWLRSIDQPFARDATGRVTQIVGSAHEITEEKEVELRRAESEARFQAIVDRLPDALFIVGPGGEILEINPAACVQLGYTPEALLALNYLEVVAPERRSEAADRLAERGSLVPSGSTESVHLRKDGVRVPVEVVFLPIALRGRRVSLGIARDISERKASVRRLEEEAALREAVIESAVEGICVWEEVEDRPGALRFSVWNRRMTEISGYTREDLDRFGWGQMMDRDSDTQARVAERMSGLRSGQGFAGEEWAITAKDGTRRTLLLSAQPILAPSGKPRVVSVVHDVTDRVRLENHLRDAQRLEVIGRLAGAVAHDFNNILAAILAGAGFIRDLSEVPPDVRAMAADVVTAAQRGADLTKQLLTFGRRQRIELKKIDLSDVVEKTLRIVRRLLDGGITLDQELSSACYVHADAGMLSQVVMNLALNARDAMPGGGALRVRVARDPSDASQVLLRVEDTGAGIAEADLPHVFEPFFTTKTEGRGTGLGLATVHGIVAQHAGEITAESQVGRGTTFSVRLPAVGQPLAPGERAPDLASGEGLGILLVEDQADFRRMLRRMLEDSGHRVWDAGSAAGALQCWREHAAEISFVVTDVALGDGVGGPALAQRLIAERPSLLVIYMSGFDPSLSKLTLSEGHDFIAKPFEIGELLAMIGRRAALASRDLPQRPQGQLV